MFHRAYTIQQYMIESELGNESEITSLDLSNYRLFSLDTEQLGSLQIAFARYTSLKTLNLSYNAIGGIKTPADIEALCAAFTPCDSLEHLNLTNNLLDLLSLPCLNALGNTVRKYPSLRVLNLTENYLGSSAVNRAESYNLWKDCRSLKELILKTNHLNMLSVSDIDALGNSWTQCESLEAINLSNNDLFLSEFPPVEALGNAWEKCKLLQHLNLDNNGLHTLNDKEFDMFLLAIKKCPKLHSINIDALRQLSLSRRNAVDAILRQHESNLRSTNTQMFQKPLFLDAQLNMSQTLRTMTLAHQGARDPEGANLAWERQAREEKRSKEAQNAWQARKLQESSIAFFNLQNTQKKMSPESAATPATLLPLANTTSFGNTTQKTSEQNTTSSCLLS